VNEINTARQAFEARPSQAETCYQLAQLLFQAGDFWEAQALLQPHRETNHLSSESTSLLASLEILLGHYLQAEELLAELETLQADDPAARMKTQIRKMMAYYQTGQFCKSHSLFKGMEDKIQLPVWEQMKAFGEEVPFHVNWHGLREENIPFLITDPLPIIELEIQGKRIYSLIDTGGDNLYLDDQYAAELGIRPVAESIGHFGGGMEGKIGFAIGRNLCLGNVTLDAVPITIMPTQRWSKGFAEGKYAIGGVMGTGILKQFLATIDYPSGQLVLRPRSDSNPLAGIEIPFVLHQTHLMMAKGSLNGFDHLTFFVDSGLAAEASFSAPIQTLQYTGIPIPDTRIDENGIGGGGEGLWASGTFKIESLGLGSLLRHDLEGDYGSLVPGTYWQNGFIQDGLISHNFLRQYRWTLNFNKMKYIFNL
ncbi:MAG: aspartyl protease family protein, partial [Chloroflexi bacterium]|nr:aspartyl protease family protein [Chloroflexota bacterium]